MLKYLCWGLFLIKLQKFRPATLLKSDSNTGFFCECCKIFKNSFFVEHLRWLVLQSLYKKSCSKILQTSLKCIIIGVLFNQDVGLELATLS